MLSTILAPLQWAEKFGFLEKIKAKLVNKPDKAALQLAEVFNELSKIFIAIDNELIELIGTDLSNEKAQLRKHLLRFEGYQMMQRIDDSRGHCHKIWNIYETHLNAWFQRILSPEEQNEMHQIFSSLSYADSAMGMVMYDIAQFMKERSGSILDLIEEDNMSEAEKLIQSLRKECKPLREAIGEQMHQLTSLRNDFIKAAQIT